VKYFVIVVVVVRRKEGGRGFIGLVGTNRARASNLIKVKTSRDFKIYEEEPED